MIEKGITVAFFDLVTAWKTSFLFFSSGPIEDLFPLQIFWCHLG